MPGSAQRTDTDHCGAIESPDKQRPKPAGPASGGMVDRNPSAWCMPTTVSSDVTIDRRISFREVGTPVGDYNLDSLGWFQFEQLCQSLLRAGHGAGIEIWGGSSDLGRDAYAKGPLRFPDPLVPSEGPFIFQAKYVSNALALGPASATALKKAVRAEAKEIKKRIASGTWQRAKWYALMSNVVINAATEEDIRAILRPVLSSARLVMLGRRELCRDLDRFESIRVSYPQILGLTDLRSLIAQAVDKPVRERSTLSLDAAAELAPVFVPTQAYRDTYARLNAKSFAVLLGPPEMGKTAIARTVALALHTTGWEAIDCRHPNDVFSLYDRDRRQVFIADDAFGSTEYRPDIATEWAAVLDRLIRMMGREHWLLWTSRPAPLREGLRQLHLQDAAEDFPNPQEVEVNVSRLTLQEKAQMLYRHTKASPLGDEARELVRNNARSIIGSSHFTPLRIRRFVQKDLPKLVTLPPSEAAEAIVEAVATGLRAPTDAMATSFSVLNSELRALLFVMLNAPQGPVELERVGLEVEEFLERPPSANVENMVALLDDHFIRRGGALRR